MLLLGNSPRAARARADYCFCICNGTTSSEPRRAALRDFVCHFLPGADGCALQLLLLATHSTKTRVFGIPGFFVPRKGTGSSMNAEREGRDPRVGPRRLVAQASISRPIVVEHRHPEEISSLSSVVPAKPSQPSQP